MEASLRSSLCSERIQLCMRVLIKELKVWKVLAMSDFMKKVRSSPSNSFYTRSTGGSSCDGIGEKEAPLGPIRSNCTNYIFKLLVNLVSFSLKNSHLNLVMMQAYNQCLQRRSQDPMYHCIRCQGIFILPFRVNCPQSAWNQWQKTDLCPSAPLD